MNKENNSIDRKKEIEFRTLASEGDALLDREIIEAFLSSVHEWEKARIIATRLIDTFGIGGILGQEVDDLRTIEGVTNSTIGVILRLRQAAKRASREELKRGPVMNKLEAVVEYLNVSIGHEEEEKLAILYLDKKSRLKSEEVFIGTADKVMFCIEKVKRQAVIRKATSIIISHNHPEGKLEPSDEDKTATQELVKAFNNVNIRVLDHIIVTSQGYFSFKEKEML